MEKFNTKDVDKLMMELLREQGIKSKSETRRSAVNAFLKALHLLLLESDGEASVNYGGQISMKKKYVASRSRRNPATGKVFKDRPKYRVSVDVGSGIKDEYKALEAPEVAVD